MSQTSVADTLREYLSLLEILDDAYWEASTIQHKDLLYDIIGIFHQEVAELNKLSVQDHHYPYEVITEGIRRVYRNWNVWTKSVTMSSSAPRPSRISATSSPRCWVFWRPSYALSDSVTYYLFRSLTT